MQVDRLARETFAVLLVGSSSPARAETFWRREGEGVFRYALSIYAPYLSGEEVRGYLEQFRKICRHQLPRKQCGSTPEEFTIWAHERTLDKLLGKERSASRMERSIEEYPGYPWGKVSGPNPLDVVVGLETEKAARLRLRELLEDLICEGKWEEYDREELEAVLKFIDGEPLTEVARGLGFSVQPIDPSGLSAEEEDRRLKEARQAARAVTALIVGVARAMGEILRDKPELAGYLGFVKEDVDLMLTELLGL